MINVYNWYSSPLINIEAGDGPVKKFNGVVEGSSFDQILDLNTVSVSDSNKAQTDLPPPMMAFEESIQQQNNNTAGENTKIHFCHIFLISTSSDLLSWWNDSNPIRIQSWKNQLKCRGGPNTHHRKELNCYFNIETLPSLCFLEDD